MVTAESGANRGVADFVIVMASVKKFGLILWLGLCSLILAQGLVLFPTSFSLRHDDEWISVAALVVLPIWSIIFASSYFVPRRWRLSLASLVIGSLLLFASAMVA